MIHKEGHKIILLSTILLGAVGLIAYLLIKNSFSLVLVIGASVLWILIVQFFRNPVRSIPTEGEKMVYAPADGKVVVIEETQESEYFKDSRIQISIFMSPINVHSNKSPIAGTVEYTKYHPGKFLVAMNPKSSTDNERSSIVVTNGNDSILVRQIAGAVARRIRTYVQKGDQLKQGQEFGFIRFGSRVDLFLPLDADIHVNIGDKVRAAQTLICTIK